ncbi:IclR family transcriptional regulator [Microbacterium sp. NPDC076768]|uniref:IclR family transcriptional regulator n=1 Tax=Microbacterium sp. NPDC076768 TaxID=3154858 RepID=UPI003417E23B
MRPTTALWDALSVIPDNDNAAAVPATVAPGAVVPAADQTLRILTYLAGRPTPVAASAIARDLTLPRSTVYHLLTTLSAHGYVLHLREERRWGLGTSAFELAGGYTRQQPLARRGRPLVAALSDQLGESAHLAVMSGGDVLYIVEERAPRRPALVTDVGVRLPAHLTASGRAMLAALPGEQVRALYPDASAFSDRQANGPQTPRELRELLREVRARGYATEDSMIEDGLRSVGAAVRDHAGWPIAAVAVTWADHNLDEEALATAVRACAHALEARVKR